ncbi:sulfatase-like hydrolase/transferase [Thalassomonas viridans]|uniref:Sulfatase-like hydrolase/transferase n=1 Tax=Thalassomonas viridans TaxID=137584 RepID=A0AAF0CAP8_9GAMM|nr:alkaline phosphatase family protein [Thalassomonas viridans]WDE06555.1 sulfatase-like hydrolase/transferase [Thalassomonas viridans]
MAFRLFFIDYFGNQLSGSTRLADIFTALITGFKFDSAMSGVFLVLPFLSMALLLPLRAFKIIAAIRYVFSTLFFVVNLLLCVITITYFQEYNQQFNHFVIEALYDDQSAIASTIIGQYYPSVSLLIYFCWLGFSLFLLRFIHKNVTAPAFIRQIENPGLKIGLALLAFIVLVVATRGSLSTRPAMRKWAEVTADTFLNKTIITPARSLVYAIKDYRALQQHGDNNPFTGEQDILTVAQHAFGDHAGSGQLTDYLKKQAGGAVIDTPEHIFLVVMESYDAWPLQQQYAPLHLTDQVKALASQGLHFKHFLPASSSTMNSLSSILSGIPFTGVNVSQRGAVGGPSISSVFTTMEKLGYQTNFFYGGLASWQNIGNYVKNQGVDNLYTAAHAGGKSSAGVWGIDDDQLFDLVLEKISGQKKSFSVVMTTTYHGPFSMDVLSRGYPYRDNSDYPEEIKALDDGSIDANTLGHLWFADQAVGDFVRRAQENWPSSLFALTGDHYGRRYFHAKPSLYEISAVPFILYGQGITPDLISTEVAGNHLDMLPTILELIAPKGFSYFSFGDALQHKTVNDFTFANQKIMSTQDLWTIPKGGRIPTGVKDSHGERERGQQKTLSLAVDNYENMMGLAWYYIMEGAQLIKG